MKENEMKSRWGKVLCPACCHWVKDWEKHQQSAEHRQLSNPNRKHRSDFHLVARARME